MTKTLEHTFTITTRFNKPVTKAEAQYALKRFTEINGQITHYVEWSFDDNDEGKSFIIKGIK